MSLSQIAKSISASPTLKLNEKAALLRQKGEPVIHLGGGEPQSKVPMDAILATSAHLNTGEVRYAPADGIPALKQSIIRYTEEFYNRTVSPQNVIASVFGIYRNTHCSAEFCHFRITYPIWSRIHNLFLRIKDCL